VFIDGLKGTQKGQKIKRIARLAGILLNTKTESSMLKDLWVDGRAMPPSRPSIPQGERTAVQEIA
jgi:hypothetical protein